MYHLPKHGTNVCGPRMDLTYLCCADTSDSESIISEATVEKGQEKKIFLSRTPKW